MNSFLGAAKYIPTKPEFTHYDFDVVTLEEINNQTLRTKLPPYPPCVPREMCLGC